MKSHDLVGEANERLRDALGKLKEARQVHKTFLGLGKELSLGSSQEEFLRIIGDAIRALFPNCHFLVQLTDPRSMVPLAVEHQGPIKPGVANIIHLSQSALVKTHLDPAIVQTAYVKVYEVVPNLFSGTVCAIHAPLVAENSLFGAIQLEGSEEFSLGDDDKLLLIALANQMALALRNQRLLEETTFLKDYLENILEYANALILVTDKNRQILVFNRALEELLGFPKDQVLGTDLFIWIPREEQQRFAEAISRIIDQSHTQSGFETQMRNREGDLIKILVHLAALRGRNNDIESIIMVGQDMTQVRALEFQIIEAEKMGSLGKLAAGVVHELNNPLTSISVYADFLVKKLAQGKVEPADLERAKKILEGANRIQKLTRDLVFYGRPSSEEPELLQFNDLVAQGLSFCEHIIRKNDVRVTTDLQTNLPMVSGNRSQLLQLIINLVTNACQAMEGGGELTLSTKLRNRNFVHFTVADTGCGIAEKDLEHVFEPFYTTKPNGEGTGLGLSIVCRIVEHHRGTIRVESKPGEGSCFEVCLNLEGVAGGAPDKEVVEGD